MPTETPRPAPASPERATLSLRTRFLVLFVAIFFGGAAASYAVVQWFSQELVRTLSGWYAEKSVLYEKSRVLQILLREVVLTQKMASSPVLRRWVNDEKSAAARDAAIEELEDYRRFYRSHSYFITIATSGHYYFNDDNGGHDLNVPRYTLSEANPKDGWFYATLRQVADYQLNVDTDRHLNVTKVWINTVLKDGRRAIGVLGTGVDLTDFMRSVVSTSQPGTTNMLLDATGAIQAHPDVSVIDFASIAKRQRQESQSTIFNLLDDEQGRTALQRTLNDLAEGRGDTRSLPVTIAGHTHIAGVAYIPEIKWFLVTLTQPDAAQNQHFVTAVAIILVVALGLTLLLAAIVFDRIVLMRLEVLDVAARDIAAGRYDVRLPATERDELGRLGDTFAHMAGQIAENTSRLEEQIAERTSTLERLAYADPLTGLLNRRGMIDRITIEQNRLARQGGHLGVLILDLDHFKEVNDRHGHEFGDRVLVAVAGALREAVRSYDLCARWGGEEFLVVVPGAQSEDDITAVAEKLRAALASRTLTSPAGSVTMTASIGGCFADARASIDAMLRSADHALYEAKGAGRDRVGMGQPVDAASGT